MGKTYLLVSTNIDWLHNETLAIAQALESNFLTWEQFSQNPDVFLIDEKKSIGIDIVREINATLSRKPYQSSVMFVVVQYAQTMTMQAQQAFLKLLEEPPSYAIIVLWATSQDQLLQTIRSRAFIIEDTAMQQIDIDQIFGEMINELTEKSIGEKLLKAAELTKEKDSAINWLLQMQLYCRNQLLKNEQLPKDVKAQILKYIHILFHYQTLLDTGVSPRYIIEMATLQIPKKMRK